jgi:putative PIN family toxin of toxin-antitoxin system
MRVVLDTNELLSGLINPQGTPAQLLVAWRAGRFDLVTAAEQLVELAAVSRRPVLRSRLAPAHVGRFINSLRELAYVVQRLPVVARSSNPAENFLLGIADVARADYLVSGDQPGMLALVDLVPTKIVGVQRFMRVLGT